MSLRNRIEASVPPTLEELAKYINENSDKYRAEYEMNMVQLTKGVYSVYTFNIYYLAPDDEEIPVWQYWNTDLEFPKEYVSRWILDNIEDASRPES